MNRANLDSLTTTYIKILRDAGAKPVIVVTNGHLSREEMLGHCLWVLENRIDVLVQRIGGIQEATRLLGCIQGTVMACGLCTISETREHANAARLTTWERILVD
jgi:hypothetical protein